MNKINFDTATIVLPTDAQTDKITIHVVSEIQRIPVTVSTPSGKVLQGGVYYNPIVGGYTKVENQLVPSIDENWPTKSTPGEIPSPSFSSTNPTLVLTDPNNPNPQFVDQSGQVKGSLNFMQVDILPMSVSFTPSILDGENAHEKSLTTQIGYVAKFTSNGAIHSVFIDKTVANTMESAKTALTSLITDTRNWDQFSTSKSLIDFSKEAHINFEKVNENPEDVLTSNKINLVDDINNHGSEFKLLIDNSGNFSLLGIGTEEFTSGSLEQGHTLDGQSELVLNFNENAQHGFSTNGRSLTDELVTSFGLNNGVNGLDNLMNRLTLEKFYITSNLGLEVFKETADHNLLAPSARSGVDGMFVPYIVNNVGQSTKLTDEEFNSLIKSTLLTTHNATPDSTLGKFILGLDFKVDPQTGVLSYTDSSNGSYGFKVNNEISRFNFDNNLHGFYIYLERISNESFGVPFLINIATIDGPVPINIGQFNFDPIKEVWTPQPIHTDNVREPGIKIPDEIANKGVSVGINTYVEKGVTKNEIILTTDGTFTPTSTNDITWTIDPLIPNRWRGRGNNQLFTNRVPSKHFEMEISTNSNKVPFKVTLHVEGVANQPDISVPFTYDLFTNTYQSNSGRSLNELYGPINGKNILNSIDIDVNAHSFEANGLSPSTITSVSTSNEYNLINVTSTNDTDGANVIINVEPKEDIIPSAHVDEFENTLVDSLHNVNVEIIDSKGKVISTGHLLQDPLTFELVYYDENGNSFEMSGQNHPNIIGEEDKGFTLGINDALKSSTIFKSLRFMFEDNTSKSSALSGDAIKSTI